LGTRESYHEGQRGGCEPDWVRGPSSRENQKPWGFCAILQVLKVGTVSSTNQGGKGGSKIFKKKKG